MAHGHFQLLFIFCLPRGILAETLQMAVKLVFIS